MGHLESLASWGQWGVLAVLTNSPQSSDTQSGCRGHSRCLWSKSLAASRAGHSDPASRIPPRSPGDPLSATWRPEGHTAGLPLSWLVGGPGTQLLTLGSILLMASWSICTSFTSKHFWSSCGGRGAEVRAWAPGAPQVLPAWGWGSAPQGETRRLPRGPGHRGQAASCVPPPRTPSWPSRCAAWRGPARAP